MSLIENDTYALTLRATERVVNIFWNNLMTLHVQRDDSSHWHIDCLLNSM